jgi:hypothetical protein
LRFCVSPSSTNQNRLKNPSMRIDARGADAGFRAVPITDSKTVKSVIDKFREKYGTGDVKKSRGYCLEMIYSDFLAGAHLHNGDPGTCSTRQLSAAMQIVPATETLSS